MRNVHERDVLAPIEQVRPWIEAAWTATDRDPFPRDVLKTWRKNPPAVDPLALIPGVTRVGHGMFAFRFEEWDGARWRARVERSADFRGWQGFDLTATPNGCRIVHTVDVDLSLRGAVVWFSLLQEIHDWCVEAIFDRVSEAVRTNVMPERTRRKMPWRVATSMGFIAAARRRLASW